MTIGKPPTQKILLILLPGRLLKLSAKAKVNEPLNKNDLIFTSKEEFDPVAYKKIIFEQATTRG